MKGFFISGIFVFAVLFGNMQSGYSQCVPDTDNCVDINEPGQICPAVLAYGNVGDSYEEHITVLAPDVINLGDAQIEISKLTLDSIHNLPPGLDFFGETLEFFPNEAYCVSIGGIPEETGTFLLKIYVTPYVDFFGTLLSLGAQVDSTSVSLTIQVSSGINSIPDDGFSLIYAYPNPFFTTTRIGYLEPDGGSAELRIINMLGQQIYQEEIMAIKGENYFQFNGDNLPSGYYLYAIIREKKSLRGKLIKRK